MNSIQFLFPFFALAWASSSFGAASLAPDGAERFLTLQGCQGKQNPSWGDDPAGRPLPSEYTVGSCQVPAEMREDYDYGIAVFDTLQGTFYQVSKASPALATSALARLEPGTPGSVEESLQHDFAELLRARQVVLKDRAGAGVPDAHPYVIGETFVEPGQVDALLQQIDDWAKKTGIDLAAPHLDPFSKETARALAYPY